MAGTLTLVTPRVNLPLDWASEVKGHLRLNSEEERGRIESLLIPSAEGWVEDLTNRALITQTWKLQLDGFGGDVIVIPKPPLQAITEISYVDSAGATQVLAPAEYVVDTPAGPNAKNGRVWPAYLHSWPSPRSQRNAIAITFRCGYGAAYDSVPPKLRQAMLMLVGEMFERREEAVIGTISTPAQLGAQALALGFLTEAA